MSGQIGKVMWVDLTVENADAVRDFYQQVIGWTPTPIDMGDYQDYAMTTAEGEGVSGVCHKRGENAALPSQWMIYISVANLDESLQAVQANGGKQLLPTREMGTSRFAVIQDPAGAVCTLFEQGETPADAPGDDAS